jgi:hypothetical protein
MMRLRENEIADIVERLFIKSEGFTKPKLILIGGYALRTYIPFSRYTRDCDFALRKKNGWHLDKIKDWLDLSVEAFRKENRYGFLRFVKFLKAGKSNIKLSVDLMEGEIRGRTPEQIVLIDKDFIENSNKVKIRIGEKELDIFVPSYTDFLISKIVSARPSDVRDVVALVWKNGIPKQIEKRSKELLPHPQILVKNLKEIIIPHVSDERFVNSWRGTFLSAEFTEGIKEEVTKKLSSLL